MKPVKTTAALVTGILLAGQAHGQVPPPPAPAAPTAVSGAPAGAPAAAPAGVPTPPPRRLTATNAAPAFPAFPTPPQRAFTNLLSTNAAGRALGTNTVRTPGAGNVVAGTNRPAIPPAGVAGALAGAAGSDDGSPDGAAPEKEEAKYFYTFLGADGTVELIIAEYLKLTGKIPIRAGTGAAAINKTLAVPAVTLPGVRLTRSEAIIYLETVLGMNGVAFVPLGEKFVKVVPEAAVATSAPEFSKLTADQIPSSGTIIQQVVQLKYITLQDAITAVTPFVKSPGALIQLPSTQTLILRDYAENVKRMMEVIEKVDQVVPIDVKPEVIPIKYALAGDIQSVIGSLTASGAGATVGQTRNTGLSRPAGAAGAMGVGGTGALGASGTANRLGAAGQPGASPFATAGAAGAAGTAFTSRINNIIARASQGGTDFQILGSVKIIADERTNSLLVFATDQDMVMIKSIIEKLDVVLAQVLIESIILEVSGNNSLNYGVSAGGTRTEGKLFSLGGMNNGTAVPALATNGLPFLSRIASGSGLSYFGAWGSDMDVAVTALAKNGTVNVLSRPSVQTSHAVPATLKIGNTVPYVTGTYFGGINSQASSQYQQTFVGLDLQVTPLINPDGLVVMDIVQDIQQLGTPTTIDGNSVPTTTQRAATAKVAVRDRETIILGGFISKQSTKTRSGVPILKDIPGLGALFRSTGNDGQQVELMVLIRPTVLPTPEAAAIAAAERRDSMPGIRQAEAETREEERRREKEMLKKMGVKTGG